MDGKIPYIVRVNYLAHAYLSFGVPEIAVGNLISDFVKGRKKLDYPPPIQQGIALHRAIDDFTDHHPLVRQAADVFRPVYGLYAGPLTDVVFDYFLANDETRFPSDPHGGSPTLAAFAETTYGMIGNWQYLFPDRFARMFPYMRSQNWLYNYRSREGIINSIGGLHRRAKYMPDPQAAGELFESAYLQLQTCYTGFFPVLQNHARLTLIQLSGNIH